MHETAKSKNKQKSVNFAFSYINLIDFDSSIANNIKKLLLS